MMFENPIFRINVLQIYQDLTDYSSEYKIFYFSATVFIQSGGKLINTISDCITFI